MHDMRCKIIYQHDCPPHIRFNVEIIRRRRDDGYWYYTGSGMFARTMRDALHFARHQHRIIERSESK